MKEPPEWLKAYLINRYKNSSYANFLQMQIMELHEGSITVSMLVRHELTNLHGILHGGAVGSLLDMAMNLTCFSLGRRATVLGFNTNFLRGCREGCTVRTATTILHSGNRTMVVESQILDQENTLLAKGRGTFLITGQFSADDLRVTHFASSGEPEPLRWKGYPRTLLPGTRSLNGGLKDLLLHLHDRNYFAKYLGMEIEQIGEGDCVVSMPVTHKHTNIRGVVHGGALVSLADMSMMLACATLGKHTVTLDLNINFVRRAREGVAVASLSKVIHKGKTSRVVQSSILDEAGTLLAEARGTFFVTGNYTPEA
ncbi:MAG: PaaI family thioesterase [Syntrophaceae bacterium]|nr:PaaI family thioesterase [Syntrophaceae bacterium]